MKPRLALAAFAACFFTQFAAAQELPTAALEELKGHFKARSAEAEKALAELTSKYFEALLNLEKTLKESADLNGLLALEKELKRVGKEKTPPKTVSENKTLARLQEIYRERSRVGRLNAKRRKDAARAEYAAALQGLVRKLTRESRLQEAVAVQKIARELSRMETLQVGLVLHLQFEGVTGKSIPDLSGTGNDGRLIGKALVRHSSGARESFVSLDYPGDFIRCAHHESLSLTTDGSISIWIRPRELRDLRGLVCKYTPKNAYTFRISNPRGDPRAMFGDFDNANRSRSPLVLRRWTHLVVTLADNRVSFYFDGKPDASAPRPKARPLATNDNPVRIGSDYDGRYFHGDVDDIRIYRRALSAEEVAALFKEES